MADDDLATRRRRLRHRCRYRGFLEADVLLGRFAEVWVDRLEEPQLGRFEALLAEDDQDIWDWATGRRPVPARHDGPVMAELRRFVADGRAALHE